MNKSRVLSGLLLVLLILIFPDLGFPQKFQNTHKTKLKETTFKPGVKAPLFDVVTLDGKRHRSIDQAGKVVVLNFWFIACGGCRMQTPSLNKLAKEFKDEDVLFLGFALDSARKLSLFLKDHPHEYITIPDSKEIHDLFELNVCPTNIILNKKGLIVYNATGGGQDVGDTLRPIIQTELNR